MSWLLQLLDKNSPNPSTRLELSDELISQLSQNHLPADAKVLNSLCDITFQWMAASNFKVSLQAIEVLHTALDISGDVLASYLLERSSALVERLGDSKPQVRDAVTNLLIDLANLPNCNHQIVLDKISSGFCHKQWLVKCGTMKVYRLLLDEAREDLEIQSNRLVPLLCKLMADPNNDVRETSVNTIVHIMIILGESVAINIRNRRLVPESKMQLLMQRYEDAIRKGSVPSAVQRPLRVQRRFEPRAQSASVSLSTPVRRNSLSVTRNGLHERMRPPTTPKPGSAAGAVTEEEIRRGFDDVAKISIATRNDVKLYLDESRGILEKTENDWTKRNSALKVVRGVIKNGGLDFEQELITTLLQLEEAMIKSVTDLRSQVCKEACITVCLISETLGNKITKLMEVVLPTMIPLIQNSAKVMASSSQRSCDWIIRNVQNQRILQIVLDTISHRSKEIRAHSHQLIYLALQNWPIHILEIKVKELSNAIKCGINDADPIARKHARESYVVFETQFPVQAQALFKSLDPSKQKNLSGGGSAASSAQSLHSLRDGLPFTKRPGVVTGLTRPAAFLSGRSASAIDTAAVRSACRPSRPPVVPLRPSMSRNTSPTPKATPKAPLSRPAQRKTSTPSHNNGFRQEEIFTQIQNLNLNTAYGEDEDFLLGSGSCSGNNLSTALKKCASPDASDKKEGLRIFQELLRSTTRLSEADVKDITEVLLKCIAEGNQKVLHMLSETVGELVARYSSSIQQSNINTLLGRLIAKSSQELIPSNQIIWKSMLNDVKGSFDSKVLLMAISKHIDGSLAAPQTPKAKCLAVQYMQEIVSIMEPGAEINIDQVKKAVMKVFMWYEDPKNTDMRVHFEKLVNALFNVNTSEFASMLSSFKPAWKDLAYTFCKRANGRRESTERIIPIREMSVGIDIVDGFKKPSSLGPILNNSTESDFNKSNLDNTTHLAHDEKQQAAYIKKLLSELETTKSNPARQEEQILAIHHLLQMVQEGSFTLWDEHFKAVILQLFGILTLNDTRVKKEALRLLTKLCTVQAARFFEYGQVTITKVLATTVDEKDNWFLNIVDECLKTLASHLPIFNILSTLNPIIATHNDGRLTYALRMLQRMIESWDAAQIAPYVSEFVPGVVQCYACEDSAVRKNTIFCLVSLVNKLGREIVQPYLDTLDSRGQKLLEVYLQRNQTASTHF